ncbi:Transcription and mRNA export factor SUS1 [Pseudohyphozyma bogoriensis]|nr:Transcription and mRNA export factor SUS1 [Pseudohyphozyma bogoriensis]
MAAQPSASTSSSTPTPEDLQAALRFVCLLCAPVTTLIPGPPGIVSSSRASIRKSVPATVRQEIEGMIQKFVEKNVE